MRFEDVYGVRQVEGEEIFGDLGARPIVFHLEGRPDPTFTVPAVGTTGAETLAEDFRVG